MSYSVLKGPVKKKAQHVVACRLTLTKSQHEWNVKPCQCYSDAKASFLRRNHSGKAGWDICVVKMSCIAGQRGKECHPTDPSKYVVAVSTCNVAKLG